MSYRGSAVKRHELLLTSGVLASHANGQSHGFRQRDVRRMIEFTASWAYPEFDAGGIPVENTQIRRYLNFLVAEGLARSIERGRYPKYRLSRAGIMELVSSLAGKRYLHNKDEFFYLYFMFRNYRHRLTAMIQAEGRTFPYGVRLELEALVNPASLLENQLVFARRELRKLEQRIEEQERTSAFVQGELDAGTPYAGIVREVKARYPFSLNSAMPISQFLPALTEKQALWELTTGSLMRCRHLWKPAKEALELHVRQLEELLREENTDNRQPNR